MSKEEISSWFDKAYACINAGNFVDATAAFEYVIANFDPHAARIAEQRLRWYCVPLEAIYNRIQESQLPINVHETLADMFNAIPSSGEAGLELTFQEIEKGLANFPTCVRVGENYWIEKDAFDEIIGWAIDKIQNTTSVVLLTDLINEKWFDSEERSSGLPDHSTYKIFSEKLPKTDIYTLAQGNGYISKLGVAAVIDAFIAALQKLRRPINLKEFLIAYLSSDLFLTELASVIKSLLDARFIEAAPGFEYLGDLVNFETNTFDDHFDANLQPMTTSALVSKVLFSHLDQPPKLTAKFKTFVAKKLSQNPSLNFLPDDQWLPTTQVKEFTSQATGFLRNQDHALSPMEVVEVGMGWDGDNTTTLVSLANLLRLEFRRFYEIIDMGEDHWVHEETFLRARDTIHGLIQDSLVPRSTSELIQQIFNSDKGEFSNDLLQRIEKIFAVDERIFGEITGGITLWQLNNPSRQYLDRCFQILKLHRSPLTLLQIVELLVQEQSIEGITIDLSTDARFLLFSGNKWGLSQWVWLNDLAFDYIKNTRQYYHRNVILGTICEQAKISEENAIFIPEEDPRFVQDSINRWGIIYRLSEIEIDQIHQELVNKIGVGVSLENILKRVVRLPVNMTDAEEALTRDDRFIVLDGKWFAHQVAFHLITQLELNIIYENLISLPSERLPLSVGDLIRESLGRDARLTDANEKLRSDGRFREYYDGFWVFDSFTMPNIVRNPSPSISVHVISSVESATKDEEVELPTELTIRKEAKSEKPLEPLGKKMYITLSHLDILHGNLRISGLLKQTIADGREAVHFLDDHGFEFISPIDETGSILHIRPWLEKRKLTFGDKISIQPVDGQEGTLLIRPYGERDQRVFREAMQHQDIEMLTEEARRVNKSFHDLIIEVMEALASSLHREDIFQLVDYQRTATRSTIFEILSLADCPYQELRYFIPMGKGYWSFDRKRKEAYDMKMQELEQLNTQLIEQINILSERLKPHEMSIDLSISDQSPIQHHYLEEKISQVELERAQVEEINEQLRTEVTALKKDLADEMKKFELVKESNSKEMTMLQDKFDESLSLLQFKDRELAENKETLTQLSLVFRTPLGRFFSRILRLSSGKNLQKS